MELCINCGICLNRLERHLALELDTRVITLFSEWIKPRINLETDYVCVACRNLALRTIINTNLSEGSGASTSHQTVGHTKVCILCGRSVLQRQSNPVLRAHPTSAQQAIASIVSDQGILGYCCTCLVGRRTVGCCAHVMTLVWYLGWARYETNVNPPAEFLDDIVIESDNEE